MQDWRHVTKLDPDREIDVEDIEAVCRSGTDAVVVGGTRGVTEDKARRLLDAVVENDVDVALEPSDPTAVVGDETLLVPTVLNADSPTWIVGMHKEWARLSDVDWSRVYGEAYVVLNPESDVGRVTGARTDLAPDDVAAYAEVATRYMELPVFYVEYSGTYGDPAVVEAASRVVTDSLLFYGGGVTDYERAREMAAHADVVVVGNAVYEEGVDALEDTVRGVRDA
ncbi:MAG: heptaprenylglyceryl phosphate synthase [Halobacteriales archaeon]